MIRGERDKGRWCEEVRRWWEGGSGERREGEVCGVSVSWECRDRWCEGMGVVEVL